MDWPMKLVSTTGSPTIVGDLVVTPHNQALVLRLPVGGAVWNRPTSVVLTQRGSTQTIPVVDVTRQVQIALLGIILLAGLLRSGNRQRGPGRTS